MRTIHKDTNEASLFQDVSIPKMIPTFPGIDFARVAESHVGFFGQIRDSLDTRSLVSEFDLAELGAACDLHIWLNGTGAAHFGQLSAFVRLQDAHVEFHRRAKEVLALKYTDSWGEAERIRKNELSQALRRVLIALAELNDAINDQEFAFN